MNNQLQTDAWGALIPGRGSIVDDLKKGVIEEVRKRELPNLDIQEGNLTLTQSIYDQLARTAPPQEYIFFIQSLGGTAKAMLALRIAKRGSMDMDLYWRLFEGNFGKEVFNVVTQGALIVLGGCVAAAGVVTSIFGFGVPAIPIGGAMVAAGLGMKGKSGSQSQLTSEHQVAARGLAQTIDYCLMRQLDKLGVSSDELRILLASQMDGIGKLK